MTNHTPTTRAHHDIHSSDLTPHADDANVDNLGSTDHYAEGQWYWVRSNPDRYHKGHAIGAPEQNAWLACITHLGSNVIELREPTSTNSQYTTRVLIAQAHERLIYEPNAEQVISNTVAHYHEKSQLLLSKAKDMAHQLGIKRAITNQSNQSTSSALSTVTDSTAVDKLKTDLVDAKENAFPAIKEELKLTNTYMTKWIGAQSMSLSVKVNQLDGFISEANDKIFNISLYAGISEEVSLIQDGQPASHNEKLHVFQRKLYMDETALMDYDAGGMEFKDIGDFDQWLLRPNNLNTILSTPRSMVAFQVRRHEKVRRQSSNIDAFINARIAQSDKLTFLYVRNGDKVHRINTEIEFGDLLFPTDVAGISEPAMVKMFSTRVESIMTTREYEALLTAKKEREALAAQWERENPEEEYEGRGPYSWANPHRESHASLSEHEWKPFDDTHSYFDEIKASLNEQLKQYNRIALIIQGLYDRSEILSPSNRVNLSNADSFKDNVALMYDGELALYEGDKPDFELYRQTLNESIDKQSVFIGQEQVWIEDETEKENDRRDRNMYSYDISSTNFFTPDGDLGPGLIAQAKSVSIKRGRALFRWHRERCDGTGTLPKTISVHFDRLLNASAYKKGDYKRFLADPRTRQEYLKWATYLLSAEDYVNGKVSPQQPILV